MSACARIPTNDTGETSFEQAPVQDTWAAMMEMTNGVEDEAHDNVRSYIEQLNTDLEKAKKKKPAGSSIMEIQASKEEKKATIKDIQDRIKYWNAVIESQEPVVLTDKKRKLGYRFSKDEALLGDPLSVREAILRDIATGRIRFMWGDVDGGSKGLASHMAFTPASNVSFVFATTHKLS